MSSTLNTGIGEPVISEIDLRRAALVANGSRSVFGSAARSTSLSKTAAGAVSLPCGVSIQRLICHVNSTTITIAIPAITRIIFFIGLLFEKNDGCPVGVASKTEIVLPCLLLVFTCNNNRFRLGDALTLAPKASYPIEQAYQINFPQDGVPFEQNWFQR